MRICPRCQHVNPDEAAFCYFDGLSLRTDELGVPVESGPVRLPHEFVFPSGRQCSNYDELLAGCLEDRETATSLLHSGAFKHYLTGAGRLDLARAADESLTQHGDADLALDAFLSRLPATKLPRPELELNPHKLLLGTLAVGETRQAQLVVQNIGTGLLHGTLTIVDSGGWLRFAGGRNGPTIPLKVEKEQTIFFAVDTAGLPAPMKCAARLTIITNGGIVEVPIRLDVTALPFLEAPYAGALTPRDLAVKIRDNPKPAIPLFENGAILRWFAANSWGYPVIGETALGMAAVQQFFEALGLAKPPRVQLEETAVRFSCESGELASGRASLSTGDRKWIYAHARCDSPWLRVITPAVSGAQKAVIDFEANTRSLLPGRVHEATVEIVANAGQRLALVVRVDVRASQDRPTPERTRPRTEPPRPRLEPVETLIAVPAIESLSVSVDRVPEPGPRVRQPILIVALMALTVRLLLGGPADLYARVLAVSPAERSTAGALASWRDAPASAQFIRDFVLATGWIGALLGLALIIRRGRWLDIPWGIIAGAGAGIAVSGTLACLLPVLDWPARALWRLLPTGFSLLGSSVWPITAAWVLVAAACWAVLAAAGAAMLRR
jgi:hypothetical protein